MPFKQIDTKFTFQLSNASGQSWLCKCEMLRSGAKAAAIGNRNNVAHLFQLHCYNNSDLLLSQFRSHVRGWSDR
jgi:hypothetical protein